MIDPDVIDEIVRIGKLRYPNEACGVILPFPCPPECPEERRVVEIENKSDNPTQAALMEAEDLEAAFLPWVLCAKKAWGIEIIADFSPILWHTHPGGGVGPSRIDLKGRIDGVRYMVVTLDGTATQY